MPSQDFASCNLNQPKSTFVETEMASKHKYTSVPALWLAAFLTAMPFVLAWELGGSGIEGPILFLAETLRSKGAAWLAGFIERMSIDIMTRGMVATLLLLMVYAALQMAGALLDRYLLQKKAVDSSSRMLRMLAVSTGRPLALPCRLSMEKSWQELHFDHGRQVLLTPLRLGLWAFPVVGFMGTVIGISGAVAHLPQVLEDNARLNQLLGNLHVAFDTTFVGLSASLVVMAMLIILEAIWERNEIIANYEFKGG